MAEVHHVHHTDADASGMSAVMMVVLLVALVGLALFAFFALNGFPYAETQPDDVNVTIKRELNLPKDQEATPQEYPNQ